MRDQRHPLYGVVLANTANRRLQLPRAFGGPAQRQMRLIPYAKNARTHTDAQVAAIAASIKEWGRTTPALVGEEPFRRRILARRPK